jgi:hypothetical protein
MRVEQNRNRYRTVAFRMSDAELAELDARVKLSGRQKQDYIIKSVLYQKIVVIGNQVQEERLRQTLGEILAELRHVEHAGEVNAETLASIRTAAEIIENLHADEDSSAK